MTNDKVTNQSSLREGYTRPSRISSSSFAAVPKRKGRFLLGQEQTTIVTDVVSEREDGLTLTQALPQLHVGQTITDENGRAYRIARVALDSQAGTPKLVIELARDVPAVDVAVVSKREPTMAYALEYNVDGHRTSGTFERPEDFVQRQIQAREASVPPVPRKPSSMWEQLRRAFER